jgi:hypothetical protein
MSDEREEVSERNIGRRRMLRGAGAVLAGTAGAAVAGAVAATPAHAAAGDPVVQGAANNAGTTVTGLTTNTIAGATLDLANTATAVEPSGFTGAGASLRLNPTGDVLSASASPGSIGMSTDGTVWVASSFQGITFRDFVFTTANANVLVAFNPTRVVDTRDPAQRQRIVNPNVLDSSGRLLGGNTMTVRLDDFVFNAYSVLGNLTAVQPVADGFLVIFPTGAPRPVASNVNYARSLFALSNFAVSASGAFDIGGGVKVDAVSIFASATTHVIFDLAAASVPSFGNVSPVLLRAGTADAQHALSVRKQSNPPTWYKTRN